MQNCSQLLSRIPGHHVYASRLQDNLPHSHRLNVGSAVRAKLLHGALHLRSRCARLADQQWYLCIIYHFLAGSLSGADLVASIDFVDIVVTEDAERARNLSQNYSVMKHSGGNNSYMNMTAQIGYYDYYRAYEFSNDAMILASSLRFRYRLHPNGRMEHNVTHHAVFIPVTCFAHSVVAEIWFNMFVDFNMVMVNQLVRTFRGRDGNLAEWGVISSSTWGWKAADYGRYFGRQNLFAILWKKLVDILWALLAFGFVSVVCSVVTRVGLLAATVIMLVFGTLVVQPPPHRQMFALLPVFRCTIGDHLPGRALDRRVQFVFLENWKERRDAGDGVCAVHGGDRGIQRGLLLYMESALLRLRELHGLAAEFVLPLRTDDGNVLHAVRPHANQHSVPAQDSYRPQRPFPHLLFCVLLPVLQRGAVCADNIERADCSGFPAMERVPGAGVEPVLPLHAINQQPTTGLHPRARIRLRPQLLPLHAVRFPGVPVRVLPRGAVLHRQRK